MAKGEGNPTAEEDALLDLLVDLVHDFEERSSNSEAKRGTK